MSRRVWLAAVAMLAACGNDASSGRRVGDAVGDAHGDGAEDAHGDVAGGGHATDTGDAEGVVETRADASDVVANVVRTFRCRPGAVSGVTDIADVDGLKGAAIAIAPVDAECHYDLLYRASPDATPVVLARAAGAAGGYLWAIAGQAPSGRVVVCASDIAHHADPGGAAAPGELARTTDSVRLACAARAGDGHWGPLTTVVDTDGTYAAWALGLEASDARADGFRVAWVRDGTFQFLNLTDAGRGSADGIWTTDFTVHEDGSLSIGGSRREGDLMGDGQASDGGAWVPGAPEREELGGVIDFGDGACGGPAGCTLPPVTP